MLAIHEHRTLEEASRELLDFALMPTNWVFPTKDLRAPRPVDRAEHQRRIGNLQVCVSIDVRPSLEVVLRVGFRGAGLTPLRAADHLEEFLRSRMPLAPNSEWMVEVDRSRWIHFCRPYTAQLLRA